MRILIKISVLIIILTGMFSRGLSQEKNFQEKLFIARNRVMPALVHIEPIRKVFAAGEKQRTLVTGSGVIFSPKGYVITNHHVTENAEKVWCTLSNKEKITAKVVGSDESTDIAVLQLNLNELKDKNLPYARLGNSDSVEVGQIVLALGSPLGLSRSISMGVISSIDRYFGQSGSSISPYNLWIQTDAAINPGNSGGPLINLRGEVIGINARGVFLAQNLGFAIPINLVKDIAQKILEGKEVKRSWIGIDFQPLKDYREYLQDSSLTGVLVAQVDKHSPAAAAGIAPGDVIQKIENQTISADFDEKIPFLRRLVANLPIGENIPVSYWRNGKVHRTKIRTVPEPLVSKPEYEAKAWGLVVNSLTWDIYHFQMLPDFDGVLVAAVKSGGVGENAHIRSGDVVRKINTRKIHNLDEFKTIYRKMEKLKKPIFVELLRDGTPYFTVMEFPQKGQD